MPTELEKIISDALRTSLKSLCDEEGPGAYFSLPLILRKMAEIDCSKIYDSYGEKEVSEIVVGGSRGYRLED